MTGPIRRKQPPGNLAGHVPIRFDAATIAAVKRLSDEDGLTVSSWIRRLVRRELTDRSVSLTPGRTITIIGSGVTFEWRNG